MFVRYLGHSSFYIGSSKGSSLIFDPYADYLPYNFPNIDADVVVMSHEHRDHNAYYRVNGNPLVVRRIGDFPVEQELHLPKSGETLVISGIPTKHDNFGGRRRGPNTVWHFYWEGVHFCHLGDLGCLLSDREVAQIGKVDVLFLPVGGKSTLGPAEAGLVINQLQPNLVFPMHFNTPAIESLGLCDSTLDQFLARMDNIEDQASMSYDIDLARLPEKTTIIVLRYE